MQPLDLIATARRLVGRGRKGQPRQSDLKRALSTAYYAMFHALCRNSADSFVGGTITNRSQSAWTQAYRAVEHGFAKNQCRNSLVMDKFPIDIQGFADAFTTLQETRHMADYDPTLKLTRSYVLTEIDTSEVAIKKLQKSNIKDRRSFAVWTVMKKRPV